MALSTTLCEYCAQIPLYHNVLESRFFESRWQCGLGPGTRISNSPCPFCRLITRMLFEEGEAGLEACQHDVEVFLLNDGPSGRSAMRVMGLGNDSWIALGSNMAPQVNSRDVMLEDKQKYFVEPRTEALVDTRRVLGWIASCERLHGSTCAVPTGLAFAVAYRGLHVLRLLDVEENCLVETTRVERYIALSYVWGTITNFRLTTANRLALLKPGSLRAVSHLVPRTIEDAIVLTRRLGCRFLWVDALCLMQNNAQDLELGVNAMDLIYERAWLTVASCGQDANARLRGVQRGTRMPSKNTVEVIPGVEMGVVVGLDGLLDTAIYTSRVWTYVWPLHAHSEQKKVTDNPQLPRASFIQTGPLLCPRQSLLPLPRSRTRRTLRR